MNHHRTSLKACWRTISPEALLAVIAFSLLRIVGWVLSLPTIFGPDSHSYVPGAGLSAPANGYIGFEKVSLLGDGAIRPWTITLPYALLPADYLRSFFQLALSVAAFLFLALCIVRLTRSRALGRLLALIVLAFGCTALIAGWDLLLNRESIAISLTVIFISVSLLTIERRSYRFLLLVFGVALLLLVTRPTLAPLVVLVLVVLLAARGHRAFSGRTPPRLFGGASMARGVFAVLLLVVVVGYPAAYSMRLDASWTKWYGQSMSETQFGYVVSDYNPRADELKIELEKTAPRCLTEALPVYTGEYVGAPWGFAAKIRDTCPEFAAWYSKNWPGWYYRFAVSHPQYLFKISASGLPLALRPWDATKSASPIPGPVRDAMFPVTVNDGTSVYDPAAGYWCLILAAALVSLLRWRQRALRFLTMNASAACIIGAVVVGSALSIVLNLALIPSYPLETNRVNVSTALAIRLVGILGAVFVTWRFGQTVIKKVQLPADDD